MLSSIHPLGERARNNRWWITVTAFTLGAVTTGGLIGGFFGFVGSLLVADLDPLVAVGLSAGTAIVAGVLDLSPLSPPGPKRQVNETWIGSFRGWVYGGAFGMELGLGFLTYVVTWAVYAMYVVEVLTASPLVGAVVGMAFGLGRSSTLLIAGFVDRPSRLTSFNRSLAKAGPVARLGTACVLAALGILALVLGVL